MPYQIEQMIEGRGIPLSVTRDESVAKALSLMIEHDYSQLPVVVIDSGIEYPDGMITYESILRGIKNFKVQIENLRVRDVMISAPVYGREDDLFDILDRMKETNAVLIVEQGDLIGIITSYDTAEYFRNRTEDLMRVEDIELMVKDFIMIAYENANDDTDESKLNKVIDKLTRYKNRDNKKTFGFDDLTMSDYINLLLRGETWRVIEPIFGISNESVRELLEGIREIRNALAHFRGDITAAQRDRLKFGAEWLSRRQDEYEAHLERLRLEKLQSATIVWQKPSRKTSETPIPTDTSGIESSTEFTVTEAELGGGRYAALADWLQSQPGKIDRVQLTFNEIEAIIGRDLPNSARSRREWWANDSVGHTQSKLWLAAGWRTTYKNMSEGKITFRRIVEREKAHIAFFSKLLSELKEAAAMPVRDVSPDGASWMIVQTVPQSRAVGSFVFAFTRGKRIRVELYLDMIDQVETKQVFDQLYEQKTQFESALGSIEWERLDTKRASRLAVYHEGYIGDEDDHPALREWAVETMIKFYNTLAEPAEKAILEVKNG